MSNIFQFFKDSREKFLDLYHEKWQAAAFSAETRTLDHLVRELSGNHCQGLTLDAGCGRSSWKQVILDSGARYESVDLEPRGSSPPTYCADICDLNMIAAAHYQTVVCHQVLEHVPTPALAVAEMYRVLKPGGKAVITTPHLSRYHELPHDYFRYTEFGLQALFEHAGFRTESSGTYGGLLSFLHHQSSFFFPGLLLRIPLVNTLALLINAIPAYAISWIEVQTGPLRMPLGCWGVFQKPQ